VTRRPSSTRKKRPRPSLLELDKATKVYGDVIAVGPITLRLKAGECVGLVGHNGSGKSTLLGMAAGIIEPTEGTVTVSGVASGERAARATVSYLPDNPVLYDDLSVREHLEYLSRLHGSRPEDFDADGLLERLGLAHRQDDLPSTFSRGLRQKTSIAVGICRPFSLLLVDEPFAGLDRTGKAALIDLVREVKEEGGSVLVATHDPESLPVFDRVVALEEGEIVYDGPLEGMPD
jgi:ABC-type multidrug transport system ATPase subunit